MDFLRNNWRLLSDFVHKTIAKTVLNRDKVPKVEFRQAVREISIIEDEIDKILSVKI